MFTRAAKRQPRQMYGTTGALRADNRHTQEESEEKLLPLFKRTDSGASTSEEDELQQEEDYDDYENPVSYASSKLLPSAFPMYSPLPRHRFKPLLQEDSSSKFSLDQVHGGEKLHNPKHLKESLFNLGEVVVEGIRNKPYPSVQEVKDEEEVFESFFDLTKARLTVIFDTISKLNSRNEDIVDYEHLKRGMAISGLKIDDEVSFARLVKQVDQDLDGGLTFAEFESVVQSMKMAHLLKSKSVDDIANECVLPGSSQEPNTRVMDYSVGKILMRSPTDRDSAITFLYGSRPDWAKTRWIDIISPAPFIMKAMAIKYQLHPLSLEDTLLNAYDQGAKLDRYDNHLFVIFPGMALQNHTGLTTMGPLRSARSQRASMRLLRTQQSNRHVDSVVKVLDDFPGILHFNVCLFLTTDLNTLITVCDQQAGGHNVFVRVRKELQVSYSRLRSQSALFMMYMVLDVLVDGLLPVMDALEQHIIALRYEVRENGQRRQILFNEKDDRDFLAKYHDIIHELGRAKRRMSPAVRLLSHLSSSDPIVTEECKLYLRDVLDHSQEVLERLEGMMEECRALKAEHQHSIDARLTKSMAALSVVSMIFLPGQFLSSVFGMNFRLMPWINDADGFLLFWISVFASWVAMWIALKYYKVM